MRIEPLLFLPHISDKLLCPIRRSWLALGHCCSYFISVTYYDVQSLVHGSPSDQIQLVETISLVSLDLHLLMETNMLNWNPSKTQLIWLGSWQQLMKLDQKLIASSFPYLAFSSGVCVLGVTLDSALTFADHMWRIPLDLLLVLSIEMS